MQNLRLVRFVEYCPAGLPSVPVIEIPVGIPHLLPASDVHDVLAFIDYTYFPTCYFSRKNFDSDTALDHCSKNRTKNVTSSNFFASRANDLQNASLP